MIFEEKPPEADLLNRKTYFNEPLNGKHSLSVGLIPTVMTRRLFVAGKEVCYERVGCFKDGLPWTGTLSRQLTGLPWSPEEINTRFLLYTRRNPKAYQVS